MRRGGWEESPGTPVPACAGTVGLPWVLPSLQSCSHIWTEKKHKAGGTRCTVLNVVQTAPTGKGKISHGYQQDCNVVRGLAMKRRECGLGSSADDKALLYGLHFLQSVSRLSRAIE